MMCTQRATTLALAVLAPLALALPLVVGVPAAHALTSSWAGWSPITGSSNDYALRLQPASPGFPAASVASDSRANVQLPGGTSTFLGGSTPPGAKYGSSAGSSYLVLRPRADTATAPSTTTYAFDDPTPDTGWAFVLGDVDADQVRVTALDAAGAAVPAARVNSWFRGAFNHSGGADLPSWSPASSTLVGNPGAVDTDGASGWFEPDLRLSSLTFVFTRRAGFPVYQTWFVTRARPLTGTVSDVSTAPAACPVQGTTLTLVSPYGEQLATTQPDATGAWSFGEWATQAGYTVRVSTPAACAVVGPSQRTVDNRGNDGSAASRAAFLVRQVVPQPISGRVVDGAGDPVAGAAVTLTRPDATTVTLATDPDGRYLFDDNPAATGYTLSLAVPTGYVAGPGGTSRAPFDVAATPVAIPDDFVVVALPAVSGQVTGGGSGLGGVAVTLTPAGGAPTTTVTRGDGSYRFEAVPAGPVTIAPAPPEGYAAPAARTPGVGPAGLAGQDFALTRPGALSGAVVDATGTGVPGVGVTVTGPGAPTTLTTDAAGGYYLDGLTAGGYTVTPVAPAGQTVTTPATLAASITAAGEVRGGLDFVLATAAAPSPSPSPTAPTSTSPAFTATTAGTVPGQSVPATPSSTTEPTADEGADQTGPTLPDTGGPPLLTLLVAGALVLGGATVLARTRRRGPGQGRGPSSP